MFERFTDRSRKVMDLANQEAQRFNHEYVGTEHILLGLVREGSGLASQVLKSFGIDLRNVRVEVEKLIKKESYQIPAGKLPQTPRTKRVIELAIEEAQVMNKNYLGTEHILLGLLRENGGVAAQVLINLGLKFEEARTKVYELVGEGFEGSEEVVGSRSDEKEDFGPAFICVSYTIKDISWEFVASLWAFEELIQDIFRRKSGQDRIKIQIIDRSFLSSDMPDYVVEVFTEEIDLIEDILKIVNLEELEGVKYGHNEDHIKFFYTDLEFIVRLGKEC